MLNEWSVGSISNSHWIFLGGWPFGPEFFIAAFESFALMANALFDHRGFVLQTRDTYEAKMAAAAAQ